MNKILTRQFILFTLALLVGGTVNAQSNIGVQVNGSVFGGGNEAAVQGHIKVEIKQVGAVIGEDVYGGGAKANVGDDNTKTDTVILYKGIVRGDLYGGGLGDASTPALVLGPVEVFINGGKVKNVFGCNNVNGAPQTTVNVTVNDGTIDESVFGGGNLAPYSGSPVVVINNGTINQNVYGGGNQAAVAGNTSVTVNGGTIVQDVYGGGALADVGTDASNTTTVDILGGTIQRAVYGGGLGRKAGEGITAVAAKVNGVVTVNIGKLNPTNDNDTIGAATLIGASVYGGNNANGSPQDNVFVNIWKTAHINTDIASYLSDDRTYAIANVFGGGNAANYEPATGKHSYLYIHGCYNTVERSFGGGNAAATPDVQTIIDGGRFDQVFGGGNGEVTAANINGNVDLQIHGGNVGQFYGASNTSGTISGTISTAVDSEGPCGDLTIDEFFCGGNFANITGNVITTIGCSDGMTVGSLYGGCNQATIWGNVRLTVEGGTYNYIYGGSKGVAGGISADILDNEATPEVEGNVTLNVHGGTIKRAIFGGSNINGKVAGKIIVNVEDLIQTDACALDVSICDVYGGGNQADYEPTNSGTDDYPQVNIKKATVKNVFGGGYKAKVEGNPQIKIKNRAKILGNVYGGGNMGVVEGQPKVTINGKDETANPTGL